MNMKKWGSLFRRPAPPMTKAPPPGGDGAFAHMG